ncbi:MAG: site-specific integrase [Paludibacter sp.]
MATINIYLDKRTKNNQGKHPVRLQFNANSKTASYSFNIFVLEIDWDNKNKCVLPTDKKFKQKNKIIEDVYDRADKYITDLKERGRLQNNATKIRDGFSEKKEVITFMGYYLTVIERKKGGTKEKYQETYNRINELKKTELYFEDINKKWLENFVKKLEARGNAVNTIAINLRNIRHVYNSAIDDDIVSLELYPFRKFKIEKEETAHRDMLLRDFRAVRNFTGTEIQNWARDVFMLSFYLIGINMKDLFFLENYDNKVTYNRFKTGRLYNIKIEPEAQELIDKFKGKNFLLNFADQFQLHTSFRNKVNEYLAEIAVELKISKFTTYSARHSWATFAGELDIPDKTIAKALGHGKKTVTDTYNHFNDKKVDEANRKVIDYMLKRFRRFKKFQYIKKKPR